TLATKHWLTYQHHVVSSQLAIFFFKGSACEAPSSPQCFRRTADVSVYLCEWSTNMTGSNKNKTKKMHIIVCMSSTVKFEAPKNISVSWLKNNLRLSWRALEKRLATAEVWLRQVQHHTGSWMKVTVVNLLKHTSYQVQLRHRSTQAQNPLWSDWSPIISVPAVSAVLSSALQPMPHAAAVRGVTYFLKDTQSSHGCPCVKRKHNYTHEHTTFMYVSYSAVNITVIARNVAGESPPAICVTYNLYLSLPCDKMLLENLKKKTCHEWYEHQDGDSNMKVLGLNPIQTWDQSVWSLHVLQFDPFFFHSSVPQRAPQDFIVYSETYSSAQLSWKKIPIVDQQGFLTHYSLCIMKIMECYNISALVTEHRLENLTPATKYNISLAGMTRVGKGPNATVTFITLPENSFNSFYSVLIPRIKHKIFPPVPKPVIPDFVPYQAESREIPEEKEEVHDLMLVQPHPEGKSTSEDAEEADVLQREWDDTTGEDIDSTRGDSRMSGRINEESHDSTDQELRSSREEENTDLKNVDNEIALLIYRNGLVFDM
uniref:Interleukin 12 receptor subunit beta 1 n=1 Tax=Mastacembelus armatus TaxID=205130 RepID=A0A7N8X785_9TELE